MFIQLPLSWLQHPFPTNSFRITSGEQIGLLRSLGLSTLHYIPAKSVPEAQVTEGDSDPQPPQALQPKNESGTQADDTQARDTSSCHARYQHASLTYGQIMADASRQPLGARAVAQALVHECMAELEDRDSCAIRLLADCHVDGTAAHAVNVMVLALLLGRSLGLHEQRLAELGLAALLHDIGKSALPRHVAEPGAPLAGAELQRYRAHVGESVALGQRMELPSDVLIAIAQHHEAADGSGHPLQLLAEDLGQGGQIVALINAYDRLCNPLFGMPPLTPHEAVSELYAHRAARFDSGILAAFIRLMGVYPPGSLVQLLDGRYALVTRVHPAQPLRPMVKLPAAPGEAFTLDLAQEGAPAIRRSVRPSQVPPEILGQLQPGSRICYYFERVAAPPEKDGAP